MKESKRMKYVQLTEGTDDSFQIDEGRTNEDEGSSDEFKSKGRNNYCSSAVGSFSHANLKIVQ